MLKDLELRQMKREKVLKDPHVGNVYPNFLQEAGEGDEGHPSAPINLRLLNPLGGLRSKIR